MNFTIMLTLISFFITPIKSFVPAKILNQLVERLDTKSHMDLGIVSASLSHEDITRRGLIRSVARYLHDQPGGNKIQLANMNRYFQNLNLLYSDFTGRPSHLLELEFLLNTEILPYVALVDLEASTRNLPYAHFDAEKLTESNRRVLELGERVHAAVLARNMGLARRLAGQVLHTIQDFYSHTNWIEMGNSNKINVAIGTTDFDRLAMVGPREANLCRNNCQLVRVECSQTIRRFVGIIGAFKSAMLKCPLEYYKCTGNLVEMGKLLSGFCSQQKLDDGTPIVRPTGLMKCNHGGLVDSDSIASGEPGVAFGGINKDSAMYILSPHAHLHAQAASLAELHTEYFFNSIRARLGDKLFVEFLKINQKVV